MSNKNTEIERKFLISMPQMVSFEDSLLSPVPSDVISIVQMYLLPEFNMIVTFSQDNRSWRVTNSNNSMSLDIPLTNTDYDDLVETLSKYEEYKSNLLNIPNSAARIRFSENSDGSNHVYFNLKIKEGNKEFEDEVYDDDVFVASHRLMGAFEDYTITKTRNVYVHEGVKYEIDLFDHDDLIILEIEFESQEEADKFKVWFENVMEVTGLVEYSNLYMARNRANT